jgi:uncharacterized membrane protein
VSAPYDRRAARIALALLLATVVWAAAVVLAPALGSTARPASPELLTSLAIYGFGAVVCHQRPDRSFHTAGVQWPVAVRPVPLLFVAAAPTAVSWLAERVGLMTTNNAVRAGLAVPLGLACVALVGEALAAAGRVRKGEVD